MERRTVGRTSLEVTILGFGGNALGNLYAEIDEAEARDAVRAAYESGVRYFDTAPMYGHGLSERRIGDALRSLPRDEIVALHQSGSPARALRSEAAAATQRLRQGGIFTAELPFLPTFDFSYDATMRSFEDSLQRLGMSRVDILLIHDCDEWSHGPRYEEVLRTRGARSATRVDATQGRGCHRGHRRRGQPGGGLRATDGHRLVRLLHAGGSLHAAGAGRVDELPVESRRRWGVRAAGSALQLRHPGHAARRPTPGTTTCPRLRGCWPVFASSRRCAGRTVCR